MLDKIDLLLSTLAVRPRSLAELTTATGLARPTAYRLATALEKLRYVQRDPDGRFAIGARLAELAPGAGDDWLVILGMPLLADLRDEVAASVQLYRRQGTKRLCVATVEPLTGLRDSVPAGTLLPMSAGSAAQVLIAWESPERIEAACDGARFTPADLARVRKRGWAHTVAEREPGLASVSAPVRDASTDVVAAVSVSGPIDRIGRTVKAPMAKAALRTAGQLTEAIAARRA